MCMILTSYVTSCVMICGTRKTIALLKTWEELMLLSSLSVGFVIYKSMLTMKRFSGTDHVRGSRVGEGNPWLEPCPPHYPIIQYFPVFFCGTSISALPVDCVKYLDCGAHLLSPDLIKEYSGAELGYFFCNAYITNVANTPDASQAC